TLPAPAPGGFDATGPVYLGLRIVPADAGQDANPFNNSSVWRGADWERLTSVARVAASGINHSLANADVVADGNSRLEGRLADVGQEDWYRGDLLGGRLTAHLNPVAESASGLRLRLLRLDGQVLAESVGSAGGALPGIDQHLDPGRFFLVVTARSAGNYRLASAVADASPPFSEISVGSVPLAVAVGDVQRRGRADLRVRKHLSGRDSRALVN